MLLVAPDRARDFPRGGFPAGGCEGRAEYGAAPGSSAPRPMGRREPRRLPAPIKGSGWKRRAEAAPMEGRRLAAGLSAAVLLTVSFAFAPPAAPRETPRVPAGRRPGMRARPAATPSRLPARVPLLAPGLLLYGSWSPAEPGRRRLIRLASPQSQDPSGPAASFLYFYYSILVPRPYYFV